MDNDTGSDPRTAGEVTTTQRAGSRGEAGSRAIPKPEGQRFVPAAPGSAPAADPEPPVGPVTALRLLRWRCPPSAGPRSVGREPEPGGAGGGSEETNATSRERSRRGGDRDKQTSQEVCAEARA